MKYYASRYAFMYEIKLLLNFIKPIKFHHAYFYYLNVMDSQNKSCEATKTHFYV